MLPERDSFLYKGIALLIILCRGSNLAWQSHRGIVRNASVTIVVYKQSNFLTSCIPCARKYRYQDNYKSDSFSY